MSNTVSADERRKSIVREAATLFNERGYYNTSMEDIAEAVGLRKPTLYWYVSCKEEILYLINDNVVDYLTSQHESRLAQGMSSPQLLRCVMTDLMDQIPEYPGFSSAFHENYRELNGDMQDRIKDKRDKYFHMIVDVVSKAIEDGDFRKELDAKSTTLAFFGMCNWVYRWYNPSGYLTLGDISEHFWDIFANGVGAERFTENEKQS